MNMRLYPYLTGLLVLLTIPACQKQKVEAEKPVPAPLEQPVTPETKAPEEEKTNRPSLFGDEVEGFELEDDENPFNVPLEEDDESDINLIEQDVVDDVWIDKRLEAQQEHGLKTIHFDFDHYGIRPNQKTLIDYDLKKIRELTEGGKVVVIEGHACRFAGSSVYNMMLSERRATTIADYFVAHGVAREKLKTVGRGYEMCLIPEGDREQQAPNRRVEFYVLEETK